MQVREVLSTHGLGLGFLASFLGFMKRAEVWPEPDGLGEFIWILMEVWDTETWPWIIRLKEKAISPPQMALIARENLLYPSLTGHGLQRLVFPD